MTSSAAIVAVANAVMVIALGRYALLAWIVWLETRER